MAYAPRSNNPVLKNAFGQGRAISSTDQMTVSGAINKTGILLVLMCGSAFLSWDYTAGLGPMPIFAGAIIGLILAIVLSRNAAMAPMLAPAYAIVEGVVIGGISSMYETIRPGIVMNAGMLTFACLFFMLTLYHFRIVRVTDKLRSGLMIATGAICLVYLVDMVLGIFGHAVPFIHTAGPIGIGVSLVITGVAVFNLLLDFDFIEKGAQTGAPKYMEWYSGFSLLVTLVWVYLEILRLLSKLNRK